MASLQREPTGVFHIVFRFDGTRYKRSLGTKNKSNANVKRTEIRETIDLIKRGRIEIPEDAQVDEFILSGGKPSSRQVSKPVVTPTKKISLKSLFERFEEVLPPGSLEDSTLSTIQIHKRHLLRLFPSKADVSKLSIDDIQRYVNRRSRECSDSKAEPVRTISATTIRKELGTLSAVWNSAAAAQIVTGVFSTKGIRFPKTDEKPHFKTVAEIDKLVSRGALTDSEVDSLWSSVYLREEEIRQLLSDILRPTKPKSIYPMIATAAYTGSRRSELLRAKVSDFDFDSNTFTINERKRVRNQRSTRRIPITAPLRPILESWFADDHPGGLLAFPSLDIYGQPRQMSPNQAHDGFKLAIKETEWSKLKGWHCLRHSFISNLACKGIDQRLIDEFVGHTSEAMRKRYRHLFPDTKQAAIDQVFDCSTPNNEQQE